MIDYYGHESRLKYMTCSQFKAFEKCESAALAMVRGEYSQKTTPAMLAGSYVDAYFSGELAEFKSSHPELYTKTGTLRGEYKNCEQIIARIERDSLMRAYVAEGSHQTVLEGMLEGVPIRGRLDAYKPGQRIVDLKVVKSLAPTWVEDEGKMPFITAWRYDIQGAIYQYLEGNRLPFYIAAVSKEDEPDIEIYEIPQDVLDCALDYMRYHLPRYAAIKRGEVAPTRCERCEWCRRTKVLERPVVFESVI